LPGAAPSRARPKAKDEDEFSAGVIVVVYASEKSFGSRNPRSPKFLRDGYMPLLDSNGGYQRCFSAAGVYTRDDHDLSQLSA